MNQREVAQLIDVSAVRTAHTLSDVHHVADVAKQYRFINAHALPCWTATLSELLRDTPDVRVGAPVGFPGGGHRTEVKLLEAELLIEDGVEEMDIVMNVGRFRNKEYGPVREELDKIISIVPKGILTKVIIEIDALDDDEMRRACELVMDTGADFLKTGTGWLARCANIPRIATIKEITRGRLKVKAAGGIRTVDEFRELLGLGVERFGINLKSAIAIVESFSPEPGRVAAVN